MPRPGPFALALICSTLSATAAAAQTCGGVASFASGPVRIGAGFDLGNDAKQYSAQLAVGKAAGPFVSGTIALVDFDDVDDSGTSYAGQLGYAFSVAATRPFEICPVVGIGHVSADLSDGGLSVDLTSRVLSAGLSFGGVMSSTPTFSFVPSLALIYTNEKVKSEGVLEFEETEDYGVITLAAGLVFNQRITLRPNIAVPVGLDEADPTFGVGIGFSFGTPPSSGRRTR